MSWPTRGWCEEHRDYDSRWPDGTHRDFNAADPAVPEPLNALSNVALNAISERVHQYGKWRAGGGGWVGRISTETVDTLYRDALALYAEVYRLRLLDAARTDYEVRIAALEGALRNLLTFVPVRVEAAGSRGPFVDAGMKARGLLATPPTAVEP